MSDIYSQIVFNRTAEDVSRFEEQRYRPAFIPAWILKITWDHVMSVSYQKINDSEVRGSGPKTDQIFSSSIDPWLHLPLSQGDSNVLLEA